MLKLIAITWLTATSLFGTLTLQEYAPAVFPYAVTLGAIIGISLLASSKR